MPKFVASNPARVRVRFGHFLKCDLKDIVILAGAVVLAAAIVAFNWKLSLILLVVAAGIVIFSVIETRNLFANGDVCPAVVVDADRKLIAAFTDLSKAGPEVPAIRILKQPLGRVTGGPFETGTRLAFVALYNGYPQEPRWKGFGGHVVNAGTTSRKTIQRVLNSIPPEEWERLEEGLAQIPEPYRPGQYDDLDV